DALYKLISPVYEDKTGPVPQLIEAILSQDKGRDGAKLRILLERADLTLDSFVRAGYPPENGLQIDDFERFADILKNNIKLLPAVTLADIDERISDARASFTAYVELLPKFEGIGVIGDWAQPEHGRKVIFKPDREKMPAGVYSLSQSPQQVLQFV